MQLFTYGLNVLNSVYPYSSRWLGVGGCTEAKNVFEPFFIIIVCTRDFSRIYFYLFINFILFIPIFKQNV